MIAQINKAYLKLRWGRIYSRFLSYFLFEGRPVTTRGRWINPLVFFLFWLWKTLPQLKKVKRPTFIIGTGRSGTTVLGIVLSAHRHVGFLNEPKAIWHSVYGKEDIIGSYSMGEANYRLEAAQGNEKIARRVRRIFGAYLRFSFNRLVLDKYPEMAFRVPFVKEVLPDARFIFIARNGWNTIHSISRWSEIHGNQKPADAEEETHDWWGVDDRKWAIMVDELVAADEALAPHIDEIRGFDDHKHRAAVEWILTMKEGLRFRESGDEDIYFLRYEDLTEDTPATIDSLVDFMGLQKDPQLDAYAVETLRPNNPKTAIDLPESIAVEFDKTMKALGYED